MKYNFKEDFKYILASEIDNYNLNIISDDSISTEDDIKSKICMFNDEEILINLFYNYFY